ncbi:MAG: multicopper oxidase domain-containing protein [Gammaproteobacteria bacterium]|nr:multicopper oxidase domain-containing protein [Gammaproteobacteria bacterium]
MTNRRTILKSIALGAAALSGGVRLPWHAIAQEADKFPNPLQIPELLEGTLIDGVRHYNLSLQEGTSQFLPGLTTPTWGINRNFLGPTIRMRDTETIRLNVSNNLQEATNMHWHGFLVPAICDGGPAQTIEPGTTWSPEFTLHQRAATNWYHSHMMHNTGPQVYKGLAGMMIVEDEQSASIELPSQYGVDDIPLIVQDRNFNRDGSFRYITRYDELVQGIQGDTILVNGTVWPHFVATTQKMRLRILNAANSRTFTFAFSDNRPFVQIASDGGLLETPFERTSMMMAPAERADIIVDVSDGREVILLSHGMVSTYPEHPGDLSRLLRSMDTQSFEILSIRPQSSLAPSPIVPAALSVITKLDPSAAVTTRRLNLMMGHGHRSGEDRGAHSGLRSGFGGGFGGGNYSINGRHHNLGFVNEQVPLGDIEIWELNNTSPMTHPIHIHNVHFQILDRNGTPPPPEEQGLKDTVRVRPSELVRVLVRFEYYTDPETPYMYHCHMLEHEDRGMMGQFVVV